MVCELEVVFALVGVCVQYAALHQSLWLIFWLVWLDNSNSHLSSLMRSCAHLRVLCALLRRCAYVFRESYAPQPQPQLCSNHIFPPNKHTPIISVPSIILTQNELQSSLCISSEWAVGPACKINKHAQVRMSCAEVSLDSLEVAVASETRGWAMGMEDERGKIKYLPPLLHGLSLIGRTSVGLQ